VVTEPRENFEVVLLSCGTSTWVAEVTVAGFDCLTTWMEMLLKESVNVVAPPTEARAQPSGTLMCTVLRGTL
jgi:hypothetical protein